MSHWAAGFGAAARNQPSVPRFRHRARCRPPFLPRCRTQDSRFGQEGAHHSLDVAGQRLQVDGQHHAPSPTHAQRSQAVPSFQFRGGGLDAGADAIALLEGTAGDGAAAAFDIGRHQIHAQHVVAPPSFSCAGHA